MSFRLLNSKGLSAMELLITVAVVGIAIPLIAYSFQFAAKSMSDGEAGFERLTLVTHLTSMLNRSDLCTMAVDAPNQSFNPGLGVSSPINIYDNPSGSSTLLFAAATPTNYGKYWRVLGVSLVPIGLGSTNRLGHNLRLSRLVVSLRRVPPGDQNIRFEDIPITVEYNTAIPPRIVGCFGSGRGNTGMVEVPSCLPTEKLVYIATDANTEPRWICQPR